MIAVVHPYFEFVRNMDYANGYAFEQTWIENKTPENNHKVIACIIDALAWRPATLHPTLFNQLKRKLVMEAGSFDEEAFLLLQSLLTAASGDYSLLEMYVANYKLLPSKAANELYFGSESVNA